MQILGNYQSQLSKWYYNELITLVNQAVSKGDYAGGYSFDQTTLDQLKVSDNSFSSLTLPEAGTRSIDEDFNYPLSLLAARFAATATEIENFTNEISNLTNILNKDTSLLDQLIAAINLQISLNKWPIPLGSTSFSWSFGEGYGNVGFDLPYSDPINSVVYSTPCSIGKYFDSINNVEYYGLLPGVSNTNYSPTNLTWIYNSVGFTQDDLGSDWADLDFLESDVLINYNSPQIDVILPSNNVSAPFSVTGNSITKGIPVYVKTSLNPRSTNISINTGTNTLSSTAIYPIIPGDQINISTNIIAENGTNGSCSLYVTYLDSNQAPVVDSLSNTIETLVGSLTSSGVINQLITTSTQSNIAFCKLSLVQNNVTSGAYTLAANSTINVPFRLTVGYSIDPNSVVIIDYNDVYYTVNQDFVITGQGYLTTINIPDNTNISVSFNEYYPAYQCSINQVNWSQVIMFDYLRPYPDSTIDFLPIPIGVDQNGVRNKLPIVDDSNVATGLYISLTGLMEGEYLLMVYQDADSSTPGKSVQLVIDLGQPVFINTLNLSSYTNYPVKITSIDSQSFSTNSLSNIFTGNYLLQNPTQIRFATVLASLITVTFTQENYTIKQHQVIPDDYLRREAINDLQAVVPFSAQESNILPAVIFADGYQYEFGIESISASNSSSFLPSVFISGSYTFQGAPNVITLQANYNGTVDFYLCYEVYNGNNTLIQSNILGIALNPGESIVFPYSDFSIVSSINYVNLYLKMVLRSVDSVVSTFTMQVN